MKYPNITLGHVEAVWNKLGGEDGVNRLLRGETVVRAVEFSFRVWKTIRLGTGLKTADDFRNALKASGNQISDWAKDILGQPAFTASAEEVEVNLVLVSVAELGFKDGATRRDIYARAKEFGLELCPAEVGPQLRFQYKDQPKGEWLLIGMEPITGSDGSLNVFSVERDGYGQWLYGSYGEPGHFWHGNYRLVFFHRK